MRATPRPVLTVVAGVAVAVALAGCGPSPSSASARGLCAASAQLGADLGQGDLSAVADQAHTVGAARGGLTPAAGASAAEQHLSSDAATLVSQVQALVAGRGSTQAVRLAVSAVKGDCSALGY